MLTSQESYTPRRAVVTALASPQSSRAERTPGEVAASAHTGQAARRDTTAATGGSVFGLDAAEVLDYIEKNVRGLPVPDAPAGRVAAADSRPRSLWSWWWSRRRKPAWAKPSYLDICTSCQRNLKTQINVETLKACAKRWLADWQQAGNDGLPAEWRPVGCGDRVACSLCADYYAAAQAAGKIEAHRVLMAGLDAAGVQLEHAGDKFTFTMPKEISARLEELRRNRPRDFDELYRKLTRVANAAVKAGFIAAGVKGKVGGFQDGHFWGEGDHDSKEWQGSPEPWAPHFHWHSFAEPVSEVTVEEHLSDVDGKVYDTRQVVRWVPTPRMWPQAALDRMRRRWTRGVCRVLGLKVADWPTFVVHRGFVSLGEYAGVDVRGRAAARAKDRDRRKAERRVGAWLAYQGRAPARDVWQGVRGSDELGFRYKAGEREVPMTTAQFHEFITRARDMQKRRTSGAFGFMANAKVQDTMNVLGFEPEPESPAPVKDVRYYEVEGSGPDGVVMKDIITGETVLVPYERLSVRPEVKPPPRAPRRWRLRQNTAVKP